MTEPALASQTGAASDDKRTIDRLLFFFALVYIVEGVGQIVGLISQPLNYYLKEALGWTPVEVTAFITVFNLPWVIKPLYGLVSDFVPLFGYRRKSYLIIANIVAIGGYFWVTRLTAPADLLVALSLTAYAMAVSSTLCGAVLVENGQRLHESGVFVNQQWLWFNIAAMVAAILGGQLVQHLSPAGALHTAALIVGLAPFLVIFGTLFLIEEKKTSINVQGMKGTFHGLIVAFRRRELLIVTAFIFLYYFSPGLATPLYYHMTDELKFSQGYIGILSSIASAGWIVGALLYRRLLEDLSMKKLLNLSIVFGTVTTLAYLLLSNEASAAVINFCSGFSAMLATVATVTLAADYCPPRAEGFSFAVLMSVINFNIGSYLYTNVFQHNLTPLIITSAAFTAFAFVLVPLLRLGDKPQGAPANSGSRMEPTSPAAR